MVLLKQSIAVTIKAGPALDKTDGVTEETGLTIAQADIRISKNGGNFAQSNNVVGATHDELGYYGVPLDTTDTNTLGALKVAIHDAATHLPIWHEFMVVPANVYDALVAGSDVLQADVTQLAGAAQSLTDLKDFADSGYDPVTNKVEGVKLTDTCTTNTDQAGTDNAALASVCTEGRLAELDASNLPADIAAIPTTAMRGTDNAALASGLSTHDGKLDAVDTIVDAIKVVTDSLPDAGALNDLAVILADTNELQGDWTNGGRLDLLLDAIKAVTDNLRLKKNTAVSNFPIFMVLSSDHITGATGKTVAAQRSIDGGAFGNCANSVTEIANGMYKINLAASDLNGDTITLKFTNVDSDARLIPIVTVP